MLIFSGTDGRVFTTAAGTQIEEPLLYGASHHIGMASLCEERLLEEER
jgi:hypothetical protein